MNGYCVILALLPMQEQISSTQQRLFFSKLGVQMHSLPRSRFTQNIQNNCTASLTLLWRHHPFIHFYDSRFTAHKKDTTSGLYLNFIHGNDSNFKIFHISVDIVEYTLVKHFFEELYSFAYSCKLYELDELT